MEPKLKKQKSIIPDNRQEINHVTKRQKNNNMPNCDDTENTPPDLPSLQCTRCDGKVTFGGVQFEIDHPCHEICACVHASNI